MLDVTATLSVVSDAAGVELYRFRLGHVAADGTQQHGLSLADAWAVRFEAMSPARRYTRRELAIVEQQALPV